jgi:hypothetical protein
MPKITRQHCCRKQQTENRRGNRQRHSRQGMWAQPRQLTKDSFYFPAVVERSVTSKLPFLFYLPVFIFLPFTVWESKLYPQDFDINISNKPNIYSPHNARRHIRTLGVYLSSSVFYHGQQYVAISRVTSSANIKIFSGQGPDEYMRNVVNREVLEM